MNTYTPDDLLDVIASLDGEWHDGLECYISARRENGRLVVKMETPESVPLLECHVMVEEVNKCVCGFDGCVSCVQYGHSVGCPLAQ